MGLSGIPIVLWVRPFVQRLRIRSPKFGKSVSVKFTDKICIPMAIRWPRGGFYVISSSFLLFVCYCTRCLWFRWLANFSQIYIYIRLSQASIFLGLKFDATTLVWLCFSGSFAQRRSRSLLVRQFAKDRKDDKLCPISALNNLESLAAWRTNSLQLRRGSMDVHKQGWLGNKFISPFHGWPYKFPLNFSKQSIWSKKIKLEVEEHCV